MPTQEEQSMADLIESAFLSLDQTRIHEDALASNARQPGYRRLHFSCDGGRGFTELRHRHARVPGRRLARSSGGDRIWPSPRSCAGRDPRKRHYDPDNTFSSAIPLSAGQRVLAAEVLAAE
jgi:hypothetical protein